MSQNHRRRIEFIRESYTLVSKIYCFAHIKKQPGTAKICCGELDRKRGSRLKSK